MGTSHSQSERDRRGNLFNLKEPDALFSSVCERLTPFLVLTSLRAICAHVSEELIDCRSHISIGHQRSVWTDVKNTLVVTKPPNYIIPCSSFQKSRMVPCRRVAVAGTQRRGGNDHIGDSRKCRILDFLAFSIHKIATF